jgi:hypothetical protein
VLAAVLGYNYRSVVLDWALSASSGQDVLADAGAAQEVHGVDYDDVYGNSAHSHFSLSELTVPAEDAADSSPSQPLPRPFGIEGAWTTNMMAQNEAGLLTRNNCTYSLTGLNLTLKESAGEIRGSGDYNLRAHECTSGVTAVSAYVVATGFFNPPYVKLSMLENEGGDPLFVFYGTTRPEGILGQVRTTDGRLVAEHVSLNAPAK